jgi:hypothetical protein
MYHKNGSIILLWWPSSSRKGLAMEWSYTPKVSKNTSMSFSRVEVMLAFGEVPKKQGIFYQGKYR